jgi:hypothetical protein
MMDFLPFEKLTYPLIDAFRKKGKRWLVSQTLRLNITDPALLTKTLLLMTHYDDKSMAFVHLKAVEEDRYASVIDLEREVHRRQLDNVLANDSRYIAFSALIRNRERVEQQAKEIYKEKYWRFLQQHSKGGISPTKHLRPSLQLIFGELFVVLKYGAETLRTRLVEIEKM